MTTTLTDTFNREDIRRVHASLAADYRIVAEWTGLHSATEISRNIAAVQVLAEEQYLKEVHMQLCTSLGTIREAAVYRVSTNASGWSSDRPGDLYWASQKGDYLQLIVFFNLNWLALTPAERSAFQAVHMPGWGPTDFSGNYGSMSSVADRRYTSRAYGMERTRYSA